MLDRASAARRNLPARAARPENLAELRLAVPDREGVLAEITTLAGDLGTNIYDIEIAHSAEGPRGVLTLVVASADAARLRGGARGGRLPGHRPGAGVTPPPAPAPLPDASRWPAAVAWPAPSGPRGTSPSRTGPC